MTERNVNPLMIRESNEQAAIGAGELPDEGYCLDCKEWVIPEDEATDGGDGWTHWIRICPNCGEEMEA